MPDELPSGEQDPQNPAGDGVDTPNTPAGDGEGGDGQKTVEEQLANANALISDLKTVAGVRTVKELKGKLTPKIEPPKAAEKKPEQGEYITREEIALFNQGYSPEEIDVAKRIAPGKSIAEAVEDPTAKAAISGIRASRKQADATPTPSNRTPVFQGKAYDQLKPEERKGQYASTIGTLIDKARNKGARSPGR